MSAASRHLEHQTWPQLTQNICCGVIVSKPGRDSSTSFSDTHCAVKFGRGRKMHDFRCIDRINLYITSLFILSFVMFCCMCFGKCPWLMCRLGNRGVRVSVFGLKSCVFLAVCGQIWKKNLGLKILGQVKGIQNFC